jgi:hypothetical protein
MMQGGDSMGGELIVLTDLSNVCALINSMAMICFTVVLFILGTMATWRLIAEKEELRFRLADSALSRDLNVSQQSLKIIGPKNPWILRDLLVNRRMKFPKNYS